MISFYLNRQNDVPKIITSGSVVEANRSLDVCVVII